MTSPAPRYHGYRFPSEIISHAVWFYHRFGLSFRDVEDLLEILSKVVDGVSSGGFLSDAIDERHAIDDLDDQLSPVQCSPLFLRGQRQLEDHR